MVGKTIFHYKILEKEGSGGMGVVYKALDTMLDRFVALKFLPPHLSENEAEKMRFIHEAKAASALDHPNICTIYEINETEDGQMFIAMAYYEGETLAKKVTSGQLSVDGVIEIVTQIANGLAKAHEYGITHRDIKPANVMITKDGVVKILDFGLAKLAGGTRLTKTGSTMGTAAYMSPEQVQRMDADHRTDIWSLGVVLYEMLTGKLPFEGEYEQAIMYGIVNDEPQPVLSYRSEIPPPLGSIVLKALAKNPDERFQEMGDMLADLRTLKDESAAPSHATPARALRQSRLIRNLTIVTAVLVLGMAGLLWYQFFGKAGNTAGAPPRVMPLTRYLGNESHPDFSPDDTRIAFSWNGEQEDNYDIYVKLIGTESISRLTTGPELEIQPAWSPDGHTIAFLRRLSVDKAGLYLMPSLGGPARKLTEIHYWGGRSIAERYYTNIAWHPRGQWLVVSDKASTDSPFGLYLVSVKTGEKIDLHTTSVHSGLGDGAAAFSPDGNSLLFTNEITYGSGAAYLLELDEDLKPADKPKRLTFDDRLPHDVALTPNGENLVYSTESGLSQISLDGPGKPIQLLSRKNIGTIAISGRGQQLVYDQEVLEVNIWRMPLSDTLTSSLRPTPLILSTAMDMAPQYSPDGQKIAFGSDRSDYMEVWICDDDGRNLQQLTFFNGPAGGSPRWSPDGRFIVFDHRPEGQSELYMINADGGAPRRLTNNPADDMTPSWSNDGEWIYFGSNRGTVTAEFQVWKIRLDGTGATQVTRNGGFSPFESYDGRYLYYVKEYQMPTTIWQVPVSGGEERQFIDQLSHWKNFTVAAGGIYFVQHLETKEQSEDLIQYFKFATGKIETIATLAKRSFGGLAVSPDHGLLLYGQMERHGMDLYLMESFQ